MIGKNLVTIDVYQIGARPKTKAYLWQLHCGSFADDE
jgi:hypothetical protein